MDPTRDNPIFRFKAAWWALGLFALFAVALAVAWLLRGEEGPTLEEVAAVDRYKNAEEVTKAQEAQLGWKEIEEDGTKLIQAPPKEVFAHVGNELLKAPPAAVVRPDQVVPGTPTAKKLEEKAAEAAAKVEIPTVPDDAPIDPAVMELGKNQYLTCSACHGPEGQGVANVAPPLAGSDWVMGPVENLIRIQLRGLQGPITVSGVEYNLPAPMMVPQAYQTDDQIAAVLTYVRNSWGNKGSPVTAEQVKAFRGEVGLPMLTVADLKPPGGAKGPAPAPKEEGETTGETEGETSTEQDPPPAEQPAPADAPTPETGEDGEPRDPQ